MAENRSVWHMKLKAHYYMEEAMVDENGIDWKRALCKFDGVHRSSLKMEEKHPRRRPKFRWKYTVRVDLRAWNIREEWATGRERWKGVC